MSTFTAGAESAVDVQAIERELSALWRSSREGEEAITRACLWNLVVLTVGAEAPAHAKALVDAIAPTVPARALMLAHESTPGGAEVEAWVSANCQLAPGGGKLLCSEEITIATHGEAGRRHLSPLVQALSVPDVPTTVLALSGVPAGSDLELVQNLCRGAERLILDSGLGGELASLLAVARAVQPARTIDLGWLRLLPFRVLFASFFDPPVGAGPLAEVTRLHVEAAPHGANAARLLIGWFASRLGWGPFRALPGPGRSLTLAEEGTATPLADARDGRQGPFSRGAGRGWRAGRRAGGEVQVQLDVRDGDAGRDGLWRVSLESEGGAHFSITDAGPEAIRLESSALPERVLAAPERSDAELVVAALGARGLDPLLWDALSRAAELA